MGALGSRPDSKKSRSSLASLDRDKSNSVATEDTYVVFVVLINQRRGHGGINIRYGYREMTTTILLILFTTELSQCPMKSDVQESTYPSE